MSTMFTPWGPADHIVELTEGVFDVVTPGHGGIMITRARAKELLSSAAIAIGCDFGPWITFEEDCEVYAVLYEHPEWHSYALEQGEFVEQVKARMKEGLDRWYPEYFTQRETTMSKESEIA